MVVFALQPILKRRFDVRAHQCVFIGYVPGFKAYIVYDILTHNVIVSRDVIFYENVFPFQKIPNRPITYLLPIIDHSANDEIDPHTLEGTSLADIPNDHSSADHISQQSRISYDISHFESENLFPQSNTIVSSPNISSQHISLNPTYSNHLCELHHSIQNIPRASTRVRKPPS